MTLADAMRKGSEQVPQAFRTLFDGDEHVITGACALGAALLGVYGPAVYYKSSEVAALADAFGSVLRRNVSFPCSCGEGKVAALEEVVFHLNDHARWSRERIADWLDTLPEEEVRA